jgi:hypothetical protein
MPISYVVRVPANRTHPLETARLGARKTSAVLTGLCESGGEIVSVPLKVKHCKFIGFLPSLCLNAGIHKLSFEFLVSGGGKASGRSMFKAHN